MFNEFGLQLNRLRTVKDLRAKQVAELVGVDPSYVTQLERGRRDPPKQPVLEKFIAALGLSAVDADALIRSAAHTRFLNMIGVMETRTAAINLAEDLIRNDRRLTDADYLALSTMFMSYVVNRDSSRLAAGHVMSSFSRYQSSKEELPM